MCDLAPFVAAALRDKVMHELHDEGEKKKNNKETAFWTVRCNDRRGSTVYATGNVSRSEVTEVLSEHVTEEDICRLICPAMKPHRSYCCTFRHLCENVELEIMTKCGKKICCFIEDLEPKLTMHKDEDFFKIALIFFPDKDEDEFADEKVFFALCVHISLADSEVSTLVNNLKGGYYCPDLDWAFTKTALGDVIVNFHHVFLYMDAEYLIQDWIDDKDDDEYTEGSD